MEQDPLFDPTVESAPATAVAQPAAQPELPVSTGGTVGTHVLTSQPQLGPASATTQVVTQEPAQEVVAAQPEVMPTVPNLL